MRLPAGFRRFWWWCQQSFSPAFVCVNNTRTLLTFLAQTPLARLSTLASSLLVRLTCSITNNTGIHHHHPQEVRRHRGCAAGGHGATSTRPKPWQSRRRRIGQPGSQRPGPESRVEQVFVCVAPGWRHHRRQSRLVCRHKRRQRAAPRGAWLLGGLASTRRPGQRATSATFARICQMPRSSSTACGCSMISRGAARCLLWRGALELAGVCCLCRMCLAHPS
jgi:hypothetical protein